MSFDTTQPSRPVRPIRDAITRALKDPEMRRRAVERVVFAVLDAVRKKPRK